MSSGMVKLLENDLRQSCRFCCCFLTAMQAAFCFVKWALADRELGSGLGFAGMAVCLTCKPKQYCFTDCHEEVLVKLKENEQLNLTKGTKDYLCII